MTKNVRNFGFMYIIISMLLLAICYLTANTWKCHEDSSACKAMTISGNIIIFVSLLGAMAMFYFGAFLLVRYFLDSGESKASKKIRKKKENESNWLYERIRNLYGERTN